LGVTRTAVWSRVEELRALGYEIEASPHSGYTLKSTPDLLHADDLMARLGATSVIGRDIRVFETTTSTNDVVEKLARDGVKEGAVVFAEAQTMGRGRLGRKWSSPPRKGLWFSVLLRPDLQPMEATRVTVAAAAALRASIESCTTVEARIKWPNDILVRGKKVAGILTEMSAELDHIRHVILGIGIDVNQLASDVPGDLSGRATSLRIETGRAWSRSELAVAVLRKMDENYREVQRGGFARIGEEWARHCSTLGERVVIRMGERTVRGTAESLDDAGALLVRTEHGRLERVVGGDVLLEKPEGGL
jgi:BirA family biotin operon repressor/biotin-[acetyl-CoA-carboxylase] ligase